MAFMFSGLGLLAYILFFIFVLFFFYIIFLIIKNLKHFPEMGLNDAGRTCKQAQ